MVKVLFNSVAMSEADSDGARLVVIGSRETLAFEGSGEECAAYLRDSVPVGRSVTVRHSKGLRSCMNKPSLWEDCKEYL